MCLGATCAAFTDCKKADGTTASSGSANDKCALYAAFTKPAVGEVGDEVGVLIWNKTATKKIPGIRIGRRVLANTDCVQDTTYTDAAWAEDALNTSKTSGTTTTDCTNQTNEDFVESWSFTAPTVAADGWADVKKAGLTSSDPSAAFTDSAKRFKLQDTAVTTGVATSFATGKEGAGVTWNTVHTCDTKKWADANACNGIDLPWGKNTWAHPDGKGTTAAKGRFFRWLADAVTDKTA